MINDKRYIVSTSVEIKNGKYQWNKAIVGDYIDFIYDDIVGKLIIKNNFKDKRKLLISYNNKEKEILYHKIINLQISDLLYGDFKFDIGYTYKNKFGTFKVIDRLKNNSKKYKVECLTCGFKFERNESDLEKNRGCPCCSGRIVVPEINDMWTKNPELAKLLADPGDGYKYTEFTNQILKWKCPDCGEIIYKRASTVNERGLGCHSCGNGISYPNRFIFNFLKELGVNFKSEKIFTWSKRRMYDFYLENYNCIIEAHGMQHYKDCGFTVGVKEQQKIDKQKENLAKNNGITKYIIIDCRYSDKDFIKNSIKNSMLNKLFDLSKIDFDKINEKSKEKILFKIVELYNNNMEVAEIAQKYNLTIQAIYKYLHKAEKMELVKFNYDKSKNIRAINSHNTYYQNHSIPIKCINNGYYFGSLALIESKSENIFGHKILKSCVCVALKDNKQTYGYTFKYVTREEFNHQKDTNPDKVFGDKFINININENKTNKAS